MEVSLSRSSHGLEPIHGTHKASLPSCPPDLPFHVDDAHFLSRFLVVIKPLAVCEIDSGELRAGLQADRLPVAL